MQLRAAWIDIPVTLQGDFQTQHRQFTWNRDIAQKKVHMDLEWGYQIIQL